MTNPVKYRRVCRLCSSDRLRRFIHFDDVPFFDEVVPAQNAGREFVAPMDVYWCADCMSAQSLHDVDIDDYYRGYAYVASSSAFARRYMQYLSDYAFKHFFLKSGDRVIDIGSADGFQLQCFLAKGAQVLGFEPAGNLAEMSHANGIPVRNELFTDDSTKSLSDEFQIVQAVVLLHTFDHLLDPGPILVDIARILDPERGVLLLEIHDLEQILEKRETALFGHEHAIYLHKASLARLLKRHGFDVIDIDFVPAEFCRGSSMTVAAALTGSLHSPVTVEDPDTSFLDQWSTYESFQAKVDLSFTRLREYIQDSHRRGERVAGYGGWGRGVTTMAMAGLTSNDLVYVLDRNPALFGCVTPGTHIPIQSPNLLDAADVREVIVFNYAYLDEIRDELAGFVGDGGLITSVLDVIAPEGTRDPLP